MSNQEQEKASFLYTAKSVLWAMLGVRRGKGYDEDIRKIKPKQAIIAGIIAVFLFVMMLYFVVSIVMGQVSG